jgi:hypothetical protein
MWLNQSISILRVQAFCDQTIDGGGWVLQYAYKHKGGEARTLIANRSPSTNFCSPWGSGEG